MKKLLLLTAIVSLGLLPAFAQFGPRGGGQGPRFDGATAKLFGANQTFSASLEIQAAGINGGGATLPGKISFDTGKSRFEVNMTQMKTAQMPPGTADQLKSMGMDSVIFITRPDLKLAYVVYPGLNSYAEMPTKQASADTASPDDFKVETAELGKEAVDGHDCVKNKVTVTDKDGNKHESTVWNATDLKNFPVKIVTAEEGRNTTMLFKDVSFDKPASSGFEAPSGLTKYDSLQTMMQTEMMKKMGGGMGVPPAQH
jgi:hypothetical protein